MIPKTMKAVVLSKSTPAEQVRLTEISVPPTRLGWVLVKVKAFGLNHSEQILRLHEIEADYIHKPIIPGIECVGEIADPSDSQFRKGDKVAALMGGMGRSFHGSYGEYALLPVSHVFPVQTDLSWAEMAAVPETYFTAWGSLFECLNLKKKDILLIRGGTCALGYVAVQLGNHCRKPVFSMRYQRRQRGCYEPSGEAVISDTGDAFPADGIPGHKDFGGGNRTEKTATLPF